MKQVLFLLTLIGVNAVAWDASTCKTLDLEKLKKKLTINQFHITQEKGTEPAGSGLYTDNHAEGIYVDVVSGEPLFSSKDKFDSGTGWPSFTKPISASAIKTNSDTSLSMQRTEVVSSCAGSHLGHVFNDGPADRGGLRYCMNSDALKFIPKNKLKAAGYDQFSSLFLPPIKTETAIFAGGCFWSMQKLFDSMKDKGVLRTTAGFTGGKTENPTYEQVSTGKTGHKEAVEVVYDPAKIKYGDLLMAYWHDTDPTDAKGQFCDHGDEYTPVIYYSVPEQRAAAEGSKSQIERSKVLKGPIATQILPAGKFYAAEDYHQEYHLNNHENYTRYRQGCRRDETLKKVWGAGNKQ